MSAFWNWLKDESNRKVLAFLGAGALAVAGYFGLGIGKKEEPPLTVKENPAKSAPALGAVPLPLVVANPQAANATAGGTAINASGNAQVTVKP